MSSTILAMLTAVERKMQRDRTATFFDLRESGYSSRRAAFYSVRCCWPDAVTQLRGDLPYEAQGCVTYYGSTALAAVGI